MVCPCARAVTEKIRLEEDVARFLGVLRDERVRAAVREVLRP
jgi:hypothetical protein